MREYDLPSPAFLLLISRLFAWTFAIFKYWSAGVWRFLCGQKPKIDRGRRLRSILESMGGTAIKLGHEIALRLDILPLDICNELTAMPDRGTSIDIKYVVERVEAASGRTLQNQFQTFDPVPIVSDSISCVYQAVLRNGERVAVKVRRPKLLQILSADLRALGWLLGTLEFLTLVRPGTFSLLEKELRLKLGEELDFLMAARYQRLFRRRAKRSGIKYLSAARINHEFSSQDVMVSEFISGVWCHEIIQAQQTNDVQMKTWLATQNISPRKVARRMLQVMWWAQFENPFFPVEPRANSIVIQPGNKIVFVNLGECGRISGGKREIYSEALRRLTMSDVTGATDMLLQLLAPLPFIDADEFRSILELELWQHLFSLQHTKSLPWERTSNRLWLDLLQTAHKFGVPVHLEIIRLMRSNLMVDRIASMLWPKMTMLKEFKRYQVKADKRKIERGMKEVEINMGGGSTIVNPTNVKSFFERLRRLRFWVDNNTRSVPLQFMSLSTKSAYVFSATLHVISVGVILGGLSFIFVGIKSAIYGTDESLSSLAAQAVEHPLFIIVMLCFVILTIRKVLQRMGDRDQL